MSDLRLTDSSVAALRAGLTSVADGLDRARRTLTGHDAAAVGAPRLVAAVDDFADDWSYGLGKLGEGVATAVTDLDTIRTTFADVDQRLTGCLTRDGSGA